MQNSISKSKSDWLIAAALFVGAFALYVRTLAPSVAFIFDDTLEFQYIVPRLGIIHQTGYPLYTLLAKLFTLAVPINDPAFRLNLFSALVGAFAVAMLYHVIRHLTAYRFAAIIGAATFAVGQTFWSQAVIAETYTMQMLLVALLFYFALTWGEEIERGNAQKARARFYALAFVMGLGLAHHRLLLLLYPAIALYVVLVALSFRGNEATEKSPKNESRFLAHLHCNSRSAVQVSLEMTTWFRAAILFLAPLLLYLYLPIRGAVGSADGTYENTLPGFLAWVTAQQYTVFLTQNPLDVQRDAPYYWTLFQNQFSILGLALAVMGIVWLAHRRREWAMLIAAIILQALFVFNYRVANVYVHFQTTFLLLAIFVGAGADGLFNIFNSQRSAGWTMLARPLLAILLLLIPFRLLVSNYAMNDLSTKWDVHDYAIDLLAQRDPRGHPGRDDARAIFPRQPGVAPRPFDWLRASTANDSRRPRSRPSRGDR